MARPRSEDKQIALLEAATEIVAAQGLGAPTALIAKRAGVAEGTLFRYFPTKDDLLNALYVYHCQSASEASQSVWDETAPLKDRIQHTWGEWIDWGVDHPEAFKAMAQLEVSDKLSQEAREEGLKICGDAAQIFDSIAFEGLPDQLSGIFFNALSTAIAQATIDFAISHPEHTEASKAAAFDMVWKGLTWK